MSSFIKYLAHVAGLYPLFRRAKRAYQRAVGLRHPMQDIQPIETSKLIKLGSKSCGWTIVDDPSLQDGIVVSAGLGEDGSFDIELAEKYNAIVHIVDPTPRAVAHFNAISSRLGAVSECAYSQGGTQPVKAYNLKKIRPDQLHLYQVALWNEKSKVKFFLPKNCSNVSHSIINFQNNYAQDTPFIEVEAVPLDQLLDSVGVALDDVALLKLDIEGAEIEVLQSILGTQLRPKQILVEFDELNVPTKQGITRVTTTYNKLVKAGYQLVYTDQQADFLFLRT